MLTILHPEVLLLVSDIQVGLLPFWFDKDEWPTLVIKAPKEAILAAKMNQGFKIYTAPIFAQNQNTMGLVTAFFDNEDEPLVILNTMFDEPCIQTFRNTLLCSKFNVYFFDVNNRELLGYMANSKCEPNTRSFIEKTKFLSFDYPTARLSMDQMKKWFCNRSIQDDLSAISVMFATVLVPENLFIQDARPENHSYHGSELSSFTQLVREEPGPFQERDIVQLLHRVFSSEQIYLGPLRVPDREEMVDVLVVTDSHILFIQAKDSPNTERVARNTIIRKKATTEKSIRKAVGQMKGALRYARSCTLMSIITGGKETELMLEGRDIRTLIIVKELFEDEYSVYSEIILKLSKETRVSCIVLDYPELQMYTSNLGGEDAFFAAYDRVFVHGTKSGVFPRLRFGLIDRD